MNVWLLLIFPLTVVCTEQFQWNETPVTANNDTITVRWAEDCGFNFHNNETRGISRDDCIRECAQKEECKSFVWKNIDDGICQHNSFLSPVESRGTAQRNLCGYKPRTVNAMCSKHRLFVEKRKEEETIAWTDWSSGMKSSYNCYFDGHSVRVNDTMPSECMDLCAKSSDCYGFTWVWETGYFSIRGPCFLNAGVGTPLHKNVYAMRCGYAESRSFRLCLQFDDVYKRERSDKIN